MDMMAVDVTGMPVKPGDEVVFLGEQGSERIDGVARWPLAIGTNPVRDPLPDRHANRADL